jgi:hypothetical protein
MAGAVGIPHVAHPPCIHHVELVIEKDGNEPWGGSSIVCIVAIDDDINVGLYIGEHAADDVPLPLHGFKADEGARRARDVAGAIARIVVVNIDNSLQRPTEIANDRLNC